ncbi:Hypothetical protein ORPV_88 [Orpheovirus IHUMI-LCC2]|uniref:Uncharacterized protein n=1 Tax=Orpheovirus IHUMI-LCC2 TaxID=2023057 RepID=A0A2I2L378_9VIRU|nr:Hypothetical protein ORPV_88 [Orpheovirus IHUMI-LCC2]SNW61992.1 Hypothetical protein ORPV_88 [Orpheovirus IHUMI-LCC2]
MSKYWYFTYLCDISVAPNNVIFLRKYNINIYDQNDIDIVLDDFDFHINGGLENANNQYNNNIRNAYLFSYIVDSINMIEDSANKYRYHINMINSEYIPYEHVDGNIYRIYFKVFDDDIDENIIINLAEGKTESILLLDGELNLPTFSGRVNFLDEYDFPNNVWVVDNQYIIIQRYANDDGTGENILQGPIGIVELDPNVPTPQEIQLQAQQMLLQAQQMLLQAQNAPIQGNNFVFNRDSMSSNMRYIKP